MDTKIIIAIVLGALTLLSVGTYFLIPKGHKGAMPRTQGFTAAELSEFSSWQSKFNKVYPTEEEATYRLFNFVSTLNRVNAKNANTANTYKSGLNQFSDMSMDEFKQRVLMINKVPKTMSSNYVAPSTPVAAQVDWRTSGAVTAVKDQGQCGSCWSFSTTGVLEGTNFLFGSKKLLSFAEQQLVDCCGKDGFQCEGCSGAWPEWAVSYVAAKGITTEDQYTYTATEGQCKETSVKQAFKVSKSNMIAAGSETDLISAVNQQPVSICVDAETWFDYSSGVYNGCPASPELDHAVLLVGYTDSFYIVKNSWATSWGENGYIRLPRGSNACGIANHALTTSI